MRLFRNLVLSSLVTISLFGCGSATMNMTKTKAISESPSIYSATFHRLSSKFFNTNMITGRVTKIDNKKIVSIMGFKRVFLDSGVHTIEMTWLATKPPIVLNKTKVSTGYLPGSGNEYTPKKIFTMKLRVREGYSYFVNLQDSIINNNSYQLPRRLCISEVRNNSKSIRVAPGGNVLLNKPVKILVCSN